MKLKDKIEKFPLEHWEVHAAVATCRAVRKKLMLNLINIRSETILIELQIVKFSIN